jgi:hypothetical protein
MDDHKIDDELEPERTSILTLSRSAGPRPDANSAKRHANTQSVWSRPKGCQARKSPTSSASLPPNAIAFSPLGSLILQHRDVRRCIAANNAAVLFPLTLLIIPALSPAPSSWRFAEADLWRLVTRLSVKHPCRGAIVARQDRNFRAAKAVTTEN